MAKEGEPMVCKLMDHGKHIFDSKKALMVIIGVGILFGVAHVISGEAWDTCATPNKIPTPIITINAFFESKICFP
jgi:hypothetical protein